MKTLRLRHRDGRVVNYLDQVTGNNGEVMYITNWNKQTCTVKSDVDYPNLHAQRFTLDVFGLCWKGDHE